MSGVPAPRAWSCPRNRPEVRLLCPRKRVRSSEQFLSSKTPTSSPTPSSPIEFAERLRCLSLAQRSSVGAISLTNRGPILFPPPKLTLSSAVRTGPKKNELCSSLFPERFSSRSLVQERSDEMIAASPTLLILFPPTLSTSKQEQCPSTSARFVAPPSLMWQPPRLRSTSAVHLCNALPKPHVPVPEQCASHSRASSKMLPRRSKCLSEVHLWSKFIIADRIPKQSGVNLPQSGEKFPPFDNRPRVRLLSAEFIPASENAQTISVTCLLSQARRSREICLFLKSAKNVFEGGRKSKLPVRLRPLSRAAPVPFDNALFTD
mmetsp:Transcript_64428/g.134448  ORF Transcript_64428/g.134448 Transcript_64428/m.134448 type:complete len:319 (+) Transcript_64428:286-1242(+)